MCFCKFCGFSNCKECTTKERVFPKAKLDREGKQQRGTICTLCDRKFLVRQGLLDERNLVQKATAKEKANELELQ